MNLTDSVVICISGLQIHYLSSSNADGTDADCESLGWNRLQDYNPDQRMWKYLDAVAEDGSVLDEDFPFEELADEDYYPSLPFAALFSCFKVMNSVLDLKGSFGVEIGMTCIFFFFF